MSSLAVESWFNHPLSEALLRFNLLPSLSSSPGRLAALGLSQFDVGARKLPGLQRHLSAVLLRRLSLPPVRGLDDPALPVCMAEAGLFESLLVYCGAVLLGPTIRRQIVRIDIQSLETQLGAELLHFARGPARLAWPAPLPCIALSADVRAQAEGLGHALITHALEAAAPGVAERGRLRLDPQTPANVGDLPPELTDPPAALTLARTVLRELDPTWLSSFPAPP